LRAQYSEPHYIQGDVVRKKKVSGDLDRKQNVKNENPRIESPGIKKRENGKDMPPTPWGCEWRENDNGWSLWRCWSEKDGEIGRRKKMVRQSGCLSRDAWHVMKEYEYETFISVVGQRLRRHGQR
jgi:hypothetical protein